MDRINRFLFLSFSFVEVRPFKICEYEHHKPQKTNVSENVLHIKQTVHQGWSKFFLGARLDTQKNGCSKPNCRSDWDTTWNFAFCFLLPTQHLCTIYITFTFNVHKFSQWSFRSLSVVLMSEMRWYLKNNYPNTNASAYRCSEKYV